MPNFMFVAIETATVPCIRLHDKRVQFDEYDFSQSAVCKLLIIAEIINLAHFEVEMGDIKILSFMNHSLNYRHSRVN